MKMSFFFYLKQKQESKLEEITACCFYRLQPESHSVCIYCSSYPTHHCDAWAKLEASRLLFMSKGEHRCVSVGHRVHTVSRSESINTRITSAWSSLTHWRSAVFEVNRVSRKSAEIFTRYKIWKRNDPETMSQEHRCYWTCLKTLTCTSTEFEWTEMRNNHHTSFQS